MEDSLQRVVGLEAPLRLLFNHASYDYYISVSLNRKSRRSTNLPGLVNLCHRLYSLLMNSNQSDRATINLVTSYKSLLLVNEAKDSETIRVCCHEYLVDILGLGPCKRRSKYLMQIRLWRSKPDSGIYEDCGSILNWTQHSKADYISSINNLRKACSLSDYLQTHSFK